MAVVNPLKYVQVGVGEGDELRIVLERSVVDYIRKSTCKNNAYKCQKCKGIVVFRHLHPGVTPMFLTCRAKDSCQGHMSSFGYMLTPQWSQLKPTFEWYRPSAEEFLTLDREVKQHVQRGGLLLRPI